MNKIKYLLYVTVLIALVVIVYQNRDFFIFIKYDIGINVYYKKYVIPGIPSVLYVIGAFAVGYLLAYINNLFLRFQTNKTVKNMRVRMKVQLDELSSLRKEVEFLHRNPARTSSPVKTEESKQESKTETKSEAPGEIKQAVVQN